MLIVQVYTPVKIFKKRTIERMHLKCDVFDGFTVDGLKQPILFNFLLNKPHGYKVFSQPETIQ